MSKLDSLDHVVQLTGGEPARLGTGVPGAIGPPLTIRRALTQVIESGTSPDPVEAMDLALRIFRSEDGSIDLTDKEVKNIQELIDNNRTFTNVVKAALISALSPASLKEKAPAEKKR